MNISPNTLIELLSAMTAQTQPTPFAVPNESKVSWAQNERCILVVDRGWIFAGDPCVSGDGYVRLKNAVHVFRWESIGFAAMIRDWKSAKVDLRPVVDVEVPANSIVFRVPVEPGWGVK